MKTYLLLALIYFFLALPLRAEAAYFDPHGNYSGSTAGCALCHGTHGASGPRILTYENQKTLCYSCHDGSRSIYNVKKELGETVPGSAYASAHPIAAGPQVCTTCHNPHRGNSTVPQLLAVGPSKVSSGNAVCGHCHGTGSTAPGGDIVTSFVYTPHDVELTDPPSGTKIKCVRCHQPHGAQNGPLLQDSIVSQTGAATPITGDNNSVCSACHAGPQGSYSGITVFNAAYHGSVTTSTVATVTYQGTTYAPTLCLNCHEPHGKTGVSDYRRADGNDLCYKCHDDGFVTLPAIYSYRGKDLYQQGAHSAAAGTGFTSVNPGSSDFAAWEGTGEPTPVSPGTPITGTRLDGMADVDTSWTTTALATAGNTDYQMYRFKPEQSLDQIESLTANWKGSGEGLIPPYQRPITITGSTSGPLTDYSIPVTVDTAALVAAGKMKATGDDIRFTNSSGTQLPYWIQAGMNTAATTIWVKVDSIPDGTLAAPNNQTTIYLHYGDFALSAASNPKTALLYYDDFSAADPGWTNANITGGVLQVGGNVNNGATHALAGAAPGAIYAEYDYAFGPGNGTTQAGSNYFGNNYLRPHRASGALFTNYDYGFPRITGAQWNETFHKIRLWWWGGGTNQFKIGWDSAAATGTLTTSGANVNNLAFYLDNLAWGPSSIDNLIVRKYAYPEPTVGELGTETGDYPTSVSIWNTTLNSGSGGWEIVQTGLFPTDTGVIARETDPAAYLTTQGYVYLMAKATVSTSALKTNYVDLDLNTTITNPPGLCDNCHDPHGKRDDSGNLISKQLLKRADLLCLICHNDSQNSIFGINIQERMTAGSSALSRHSVDPAEQQANGTKVACTNCHNPHLDNKTNPVIDPLDHKTPFPLSNPLSDYVGPGGEVYFLAGSKHDGAAPRITSGPTVSAMTDTTCTVTWTTDQATNGYVEYGTTDAYGKEAVSINAPTTFTHTAHLTGLVNQQNYHFQVRSYDPVGNFVWSSDALLDTVPPVITSGPTTAVSGDTTTITWATNEASTSWVEFSPSDVSGYIYSTGNDTTTTSHSVTISTPFGYNYHYRVHSSDARTNRVDSGDDTIINNIAAPSIPALIALPAQNDGSTPVTVTLNWDASTDPNGYPITYYAQISATSNFSTVWSSSSWQSGTSWSVSIDNMDTQTWYWRVQARNSMGATSLWSAVSNFSHTGPPSNPAGSCPNLFAWNGSKFGFITDIIGPGSVGLNVGKGRYLQANPREYVKLEQSQLIPQDGLYNLRIKEELVDLDYFDQMKLLVIDHPKGTDVFPSDRKMTSGPPPPARLYTLGNRRPPKSAMDRQGKDILPLISTIDRKYAAAHPFYDDLITMNLGNLQDAKEIKLVLNGWILYPDKDTMKKVKGGLDFSPPYLEVMGKDGKWVKVSKDMGYPAGLNKTIVVDLTGKFQRKGDYRVRLHSAPEIYWDYIGVDTSRDEKVSVKTLTPLTANLHYQGFSRRYYPDQAGPQTYDYNEKVNAFPGNYPVPVGNFTKYGDVLPLLRKADDEFVVMGPGDEISLQFPEPPGPAPGMTRSYLFFSDGFFKEQNKSFAGNQVTPMPFHGMSNYPYSAAEHYPNDKDHLQYLKVWNTRVYETKNAGGILAALKEIWHKVEAWAVNLWHTVFGGSDETTAVSYKVKLPAWMSAPSYEKHYSLNTNFVTFQLDNLVSTTVYSATSPGFGVWESDTQPTPSSPGIDASADVSQLSSIDSNRLRTDNYPTPNTHDGDYNYQMFRFNIGTAADKLYSFKFGWTGYGEPSPGYPTAISVWNFVYSRWDEAYSGVISSDSGISVEKNANIQPLCYKCHGGSPPADITLGALNKNISSSFPADIHGGGAGPQYVAADGGYDWTPTTFGSTAAIGGAYSRANGPLPCNDCHDSHGSSSVYHLREHINGDINKDLTNYPNGNFVPGTDISNNAKVLHFCQSCHAGTLHQFHQPCVECHTTENIGHEGWSTGPTPQTDDFDRACLSCHYHGATYPAHGQCHCTLDSPVKAF